MGEQLPLGGELLNAVESGIRRVDIAGFVKGHELGSRKPTSRPLSAAELPRLLSKLAPFADKLPFRREFLHAAVSLIRHIEQAVRPQSHRPGKLKLAVASPFDPPFPEQLAVR